MWDDRYGKKFSVVMKEPLPKPVTKWNFYALCKEHWEEQGYPYLRQKDITFRKSPRDEKVKNIIFKEDELPTSLKGLTVVLWVMRSFYVIYVSLYVTEPSSGYHEVMAEEKFVQLQWTVPEDEGERDHQHMLIGIDTLERLEHAGIREGEH